MTTQQAKHTPGPWHLEDWRVCGNDAEQSFICGVYSWAVNPHHEAEARKNAALILAAPDLLASAQPLLDDDSPLWPWVNEKNIGRDEYDRRCLVIALLEAAISRAGEA